uniref:Uncharacterized protein n=1 Tax=Arundo donax TaxID=35708 RepID=A0A0A9T184_ARUDO
MRRCTGVVFDTKLMWCGLLGEWRGEVKRRWDCDLERRG